MAPTASAESSATIAFTSENASQILSEVIAETAFTLSSAMKSVESLAISEPNRMELLMPSAYDFQRRVIEQAESRAAIQSIVSRLTGVDPVITLTIVNETQQLKAQSSEVKSDHQVDQKPVQTQQEKRVDKQPEPAKPAPLKTRDDVDPENDSFVQRVVDVFGAKVVRVTDAPIRRNPSDEYAD